MKRDYVNRGLKVGLYAFRSRISLDKRCCIVSTTYFRLISFIFYIHTGPIQMFLGARLESTLHCILP